MADDAPQTPAREGTGVTSEYGVTGLRELHGYIYEEFLPALIPQSKATQVYREMRDNSAVVGSVLFAIEMLLRGVEWSVDPNEALPEHADFLESCMDDMSMTWEDVISESLSDLPFGWAYQEIVYKVRGGDTTDPTRRSKFNDGLYGWRKLPLRAQESLFHWEFDDNGGLQGMWQWDPRTFQQYFIPIESALLFRTSQHKSNPEGRSILRNAYRSWWYAKRLEEIEAIGIERDVAGIPMAGIPPELFTSNKAEDVAAYQQWKRVVTDLRNDAMTGLLYPLSYDESGNQLVKVELMGAPGAKQFNTNEVILRYRVDIALSALADVILLGHEHVGTQALSVTKEDLFVRGLEAQLDQIAAVFNGYAVPRLFRVNGFPTDKLPQFRHGELRNVNLIDFAKVVFQLAQAGMPFFPNPEMEAEVYLMLGLPVPPAQAALTASDADRTVEGPATGAPRTTETSTRYDAGVSDAGKTPPEMASQIADAKAGDAGSGNGVKPR